MGQAYTTEASETAASEGRSEGSGSPDAAVGALASPDERGHIDIFVSFESNDSADIIRIVTAMFEPLGLRVFNPLTGLVNPTAAEMEHHVARARLCIVAISPNYFKSKWCCIEARAAVMAEVPIIPVYDGTQHAYASGAPQSSRNPMFWRAERDGYHDLAIGEHGEALRKNVFKTNLLPAISDVDQAKATADLIAAVSSRVPTLGRKLDRSQVLWEPMRLSWTPPTSDDSSDDGSGIVAAAAPKGATDPTLFDFELEAVDRDWAPYVKRRHEWINKKIGELLTIGHLKGSYAGWSATPCGDYALANFDCKIEFPRADDVSSVDQKIIHHVIKRLKDDLRKEGVSDHDLEQIICLTGWIGCLELVVKAPSSVFAVLFRLLQTSPTRHLSLGEDVTLTSLEPMFHFSASADVLRPLMTHLKPLPIDDADQSDKGALIQLPLLRFIVQASRLERLRQSALDRADADLRPASNRPPTESSASTSPTPMLERSASSGKEKIPEPSVSSDDTTGTDLLTSTGEKSDLSSILRDLAHGSDLASGASGANKDRIKRLLESTYGENRSELSMWGNVGRVLSGANLYDALGVDPSADALTIEQAFSQKSLQYSSDRPTGDEEKFKLVNAAYKVLGDDLMRQLYDAHGDEPLKILADLSGQSSSGAELLSSRFNLRLIHRTYFEFIDVLPSRGSEAADVLEQSGLWINVQTEADTKDLMRSDPAPVMLVSSRWRTTAHPDPEGTALACVKDFLSREQNAAIEYVCWDYLSDVSGETWDSDRGSVLLEMATRLNMHFLTLVVGSANYFDSAWCATEFIVSVMNPRSRTFVYDTSQRHVKSVTDGMPRDPYERALFGTRILQNASFPNAAGHEAHVQATDYLHEAIVRAAISIGKVYGDIGIRLNGLDFIGHVVDLAGATTLGYIAGRRVCLSFPAIMNGGLKDQDFEEPPAENRCDKGHPIWDDGSGCWVCMLEPPHLFDLLRKYRTTLPAVVDLFHSLSAEKKTILVRDGLSGLSGTPCPDIGISFGVHSIQLKDVPSTVFAAMLKVAAPAFAAMVEGFPPVDITFTLERNLDPAHPTNPYITFKELSLDFGGPLAAFAAMLPRDWTQPINSWIQTDYLEESINISVDEMASADSTLDAERVTTFVASARRRGVLVGHVTARLSSTLDQHPATPPPTLRIDSVAVDERERDGWTELRLVRELLDHCRGRWTTAVLTASIQSGWMERVGSRLGFAYREDDPSWCILDVKLLPEFCGRLVRPRKVDGPWKVKASDSEQWEERPLLEGALGVAVAFDHGSNSYDFRMGGQSYWIKAPNLRLNGNY